MIIYIVYKNWDNDESYEDHDYGCSVEVLCATREKAMEYISEIESPYYYSDEPMIEGVREDWKEQLEDDGAIRVWHTEYYGSYPHEWYTISEREVLE